MEYAEEQKPTFKRQSALLPEMRSAPSVSGGR